MRFENRAFSILSLFLICAALTGVSCTSSDLPKEQIIAAVGDRVITASQLARSYELQPRWGAGLTRRQAYHNQLDYLIDEKLFALEACRLELHRDPAIAGYLRFIEEKELNKALYEIEVADKVEISEEEYQQAYLHSKKKVRFNYIFTRVAEFARYYAEQLQTTPFDSIRVAEVLNDRKGVTRMMSFGDLDPKIEAVVFNLKPGAVAGPIEILDGYMVIQLLEGTVEKFISEMELAQQKSKLQKVIYQRKAAPIANRYIKDLMLDKNLTLNPEVFFALEKLFARVARHETQPELIPVHLSDAALHLVASDAAELNQQVLATFDGGQITVGEFLEKMRNQPAGMRPRINMAQQLKDAIGVAVRNDFLANEARKKGLHKSPQVRAEIQIQQDQALARFYVERQLRGVEISEDEIWEFKRSDDFKAITTITNRMGAPLSDEQVSEIIQDLKLAQWKIAEHDRLAQVYEIAVDSTRLNKMIETPEKIIDRDPMPFVVREIFN